MKWHYPDNRGVPQTGTVERTVDRGGTDVSYYFRSDEGVLTVTSGIAFSWAHAVHGSKPGCPICEDSH